MADVVYSFTLVKLALDVKHGFSQAATTQLIGQPMITLVFMLV